MARAGMSELVDMLRGLTNAGVDDLTLAGVTYWSDDQLQSELDRTAVEWRWIELGQAATVQNGATAYYDYLIPRQLGRWLERAGSLSPFAVRNSSGGTVGGYTVNYEARRITFSADQAGAYYWLDARSFEMDEAAASVWEQKAAFASARVDWSSDTHSVKASQHAEHCERMAKYFRSRTGAKHSRFVRVDEAASE